MTRSGQGHRLWREGGQQGRGEGEAGVQLGDDRGSDDAKGSSRAETAGLSQNKARRRHHNQSSKWGPHLPPGGTLSAWDGAQRWTGRAVSPWPPSCQTMERINALILKRRVCVCVCVCVLGRDNKEKRRQIKIIVLNTQIFTQYRQ